MTAISALALPPTLGPRNRSLAALVGGLAVLISSVSLHIGGPTLTDPQSLPVIISCAAVNRAGAASMISSQDALQGTGDPRFLFTTLDSSAADHGSSPAMPRELLRTEPSAHFTASTDNQKQTNRAHVGPAAELARGTRAESASFATIETRRDDPRALLLRIAAWSRERGRTNG